MPAEFNAADAEPSSTEYSVAWVAYALQATGVFGFLLGPLVGLVISYARRDVAGAGYLASHHRWLIRTVWWTALGYLACLAVILAGAWPIISEVVREAIRTVPSLISWRPVLESVARAAASERAADRILGTRVLLFERDGHAFRPTEAYPRVAAA